MRRGFRQKYMAQAERGQSLVEMTLGFVLILIVLSGILDLGRAYFIFIALEDAVGEAALFLSINPHCRTADDTDLALGRDCSDPNNAEYRARSAGGQNLDWSSSHIVVDRTVDYGVGDPVSVTLDYTFPLLSPFVPRFVGVNPLTLSVKASQVIITE